MHFLYSSDNAVIDTYECVNLVGVECFLEMYMYYSNGTFPIHGICAIYYHGTLCHLLSMPVATYHSLNL